MFIFVCLFAFMFPCSLALSGAGVGVALGVAGGLGVTVVEILPPPLAFELSAVPQAVQNTVAVNKSAKVIACRIEVPPLNI